jgi:hypothetical protein
MEKLKFDKIHIALKIMKVLIKKGDYLHELNSLKNIIEAILAKHLSDLNMLEKKNCRLEKH